MSPFPRDSDDDPDDIYAQYVIDEDAEVISLEGNDGLEGEMVELDLGNGDEENGYIPDDAKMIFSKHDGSVFCVDAGDSSLVVSGGEDDKGYVWLADSGEVVFECSGHKDSVISCGFSMDNKYVMTADMSGIIIVRSAVDGKQIWDFECSDLEWCKWHHGMNVLFAGIATGEVYMWKIPSGEFKIYPGHGSKSSAGILLQNGKELAVGYEDGTMKLWDLKTVSTIFSFKDESDPVLCVCTHNHSVACGTVAGKTKIYSAEAHKLVATLHKTGSSVEELNSVESIAFSPNGTYIACGQLSGNLCVWDVHAQRLRYECFHSSGISRLIWDAYDVIYTASLTGEIRHYNGRNGELIKQQHGHTGGVLDMVLNKEGTLIFSSGDDQTVRIFEK